MQRPTDNAKGEPLPTWAQDILSLLAPLSDRRTAAKTLGVSAKTLDRNMRAGKLAFVKHGARVLIPRRAIVDLLIAGAA